MKIGIIGSGVVAKALGSGFIKEGHEVKLGSRESDKLSSWVSDNGKQASAGDLVETAKFGEIIVLAVFGLAAADAIKTAGPKNFVGKIVLDATNPLDKSGGMPPKLVGRVGESGGEQNQSLLPGAFVVKAFNTVSAALMYKPKLAGGPPDMFLCGDDSKAKEKVAQICKAFGWNPIDVGGIDCSHYTEAAGTLWTITALKSGSWDQAFKILKK
jgi:predicted dinucleotide-binding enzyme